MNKRIIQLLIVIIIIIILGLGGFYLWEIYKPKPSSGNPTLTNAPLSNTNSQAKNQNVNAAIISPAESLPKDEQTELKFLATVVTGNIGSYSNQTKYANFNEVYSYLTDSMIKWLEQSFKPELLKQHPANVYYAMETKVLNSRVSKLDAAKGSAEIVVTTQRQEFKETISNVRVFNQDLLLKLVKNNDGWKVNGAFWQ